MLYKLFLFGDLDLITAICGLKMKLSLQCN